MQEIIFTVFLAFALSGVFYILYLLVRLSEEIQGTYNSLILLHKERERILLENHQSRNNQSKPNKEKQPNDA